MAVIAIMHNGFDGRMTGGSIKLGTSVESEGINALAIGAWREWAEGERELILERLDVAERERDDLRERVAWLEAVTSGASALVSSRLNELEAAAVRMLNAVPPSRRSGG